MCVVPVKLRPKESHSAITTWLYLIIVVSKVCKILSSRELQVPGIETSVAIKTMNEDCKNWKIAIDCLQAANTEK